MCMSHTTGLPNWRWIGPVGPFVGDSLHFGFDPGTRYNYSGEGMYLLQHVIERMTGEALTPMAQERIFDPLGMTMTSYLWQDRFEGNFVNGHRADQSVVRKDRRDDANAAGSMETTLADYTKFFQHVLRLKMADSAVAQTMFTPYVRIRSKAQFGPLAWEDTNVNDQLALSYGLGWGMFRSPYGWAAFKEGNDEGFQHHSVLFPDAGIGVIFLSNSDNGNSIFKYLLELTIGDIYTPWQWENYVPYDLK